MNDLWDAHEAQIIRSWNANAKPWAQAIQSGSIASRTLVTDAAIVAAVSTVAAVSSVTAGPGAAPARVLDLGCGEGWLVRALGALRIAAVGIDAVPELIAEAARRGGEFHLQPYSAIASRQWRGGPFDAAVCNFSLLGRESVESLLSALGGYLVPRGYLIVQTLHPLAACGDAPYRDGWRAGSWLGFGAEFDDPAPWYFRTLESWFAMLRQSGFDVLECREPTAPGAIVPASVIFVCRVRETVGSR